SSAGEISGHSKPINAVALKPQRPFRAVTASDDNTLVFYHGVPFKYNKTISTHSRFVQDVRYAPNGERFVSAGSDGKVFVYDGKTGDVLFELQESGGGGGGATSNAHSGSIFAVDFAPDSNRIVTASADGFVKVWDLNTKAVLGSWDLNGKNDLGGVGVDKSVDQQVGVTWLGGDSDGFASISLGGEINIVKGVSSPSGTKVTKLHGPCASITSLAQGAKPGTLYAGTFDGRVLSYDASGQATLVQGPRHASSVSALASASSSTLSIGIDETLRLIGTDGAFTSSVSAGTTGYPKYLAIGTSTSSSSSFGPVFVGTPSGIDIFPSLPSSTTKSHFARTYDITSLAAAPGAQWVAVGASDGKVYLHTYKEAAGLTEAKQLVRQTTISALAFSGDGALLAVGEGNGKIAVYNTSDWSVKTSAWAFHTARIQSIQFSPDCTHAISGSLDSNVFVWSVAKPSKKIQISKAHPNGVTALSWLDNDSFASAGADSCIKLWDVKKHE
ncbi:WD40 repeat-like protein, partial [Tilletia horrida]